MRRALLLLMAILALFIGACVDLDDPTACSEDPARCGAVDSSLEDSTVDTAPRPDADAIVTDSKTGDADAVSDGDAADARETCVPLATCPSGKECGSLFDGCSASINCGTCSGGKTCNTATNKCETVCTPITTCPSTACLTIDNGCGTGTLTCPACPSGKTCDPTLHSCVCAPITACPSGRVCGSYPDGCGGSISCGTCGSGLTCDAATNVCCACTPGTITPTGGACPSVGDVEQKTCNASCAYDAPVCVTPSGWRGLAGAPFSTAARTAHTAVWTGTQMIVWGGVTSTSAALKDGAIYTLSTDTWTTTATSPLAVRSNHMAVWSGSEMLVWGGVNSGGGLADGSRFNPSSGTWTAMAASPLAARGNSVAVWSTATNEMLIWGGTDYTTVYANGAAYSPSSNTWRTLAVSPLSARFASAGVWTGTEMVVWSGQASADFSAVCATNCLVDGARYNPSSNAWAALATPTITPRFSFGYAWSGSELVVFAGESNTSSAVTFFDDGARVAPTAGAWTAIAAPGAALPRAQRAKLQAWFGAGKFWVWSGIDPSGETPTGASFDPSTGTWKAMTTTGAPSARDQASVVWTGKSAIVWGGRTGASSYVSDGAIFTP